jgi:hypothetical protein
VTHIVIRCGPAGPRPALRLGPDVWEVAAVYRALETGGDEAIAQTARLTGLTPTQARIALDYYADNREEIDGWMQRRAELAL